VNGSCRCTRVEGENAVYRSMVISDRSLVSKVHVVDRSPNQTALVEWHTVGRWAWPGGQGQHWPGGAVAGTSGTGSNTAVSIGSGIAGSCTCGYHTNLWPCPTQLDR
jgi:hypothetical protein